MHKFTCYECCEQKDKPYCGCYQFGKKRPVDCISPEMLKRVKTMHPKTEPVWRKVIIEGYDRQKLLKGCENPETAVELVIDALTVIKCALEIQRESNRRNQRYDRAGRDNELETYYYSLEKHFVQERRFK